MAALAQQAAAAPARKRGDWRTLRETGNAGQAYMATLVPLYPEVSATAYHATAPDGAEIELRWYTTGGAPEPGPAVVYAHGGGMVLGSLDTYDTLLSWYVARSGVPFLSVGYRLAPEATGTTLAEDVFAGLAWLTGHAAGLGVDPARIAVMGDSGGGAPTAGAAILAFLVCVPMFAGVYLIGWMTFLTNVILFLSLGLLVRTSGQVSLCQVGFAAIGVTVFSQLVTGHHIRRLIALLLAGLVVVPVGAVLAIPAIRLNSLYLALATLGFGLVLNDLFYGQPYMFGDVTAAVIIPRPAIGWLDVGSDTGYFYLVLAFAVLVSVLVVTLNRSRLGRVLSALASSPTGLVKPRQGTLRINGVDMTQSPAHLRARAGLCMIPEGRGISAGSPSRRTCGCSYRAGRPGPASSVPSRRSPPSRNTWAARRAACRGVSSRWWPCPAPTLPRPRSSSSTKHPSGCPRRWSTPSELGDDLLLRTYLGADA